MSCDQAAWRSDGSIKSRFVEKLFYSRIADTDLDMGDGIDENCLVALQYAREALLQDTVALKRTKY